MGNPKGKVENPFAKSQTRPCPRCGELGEMYESDVINKVSRADNQTMICGPCGTEEAMDPMSMLRPWVTMDNPIDYSTARRVRALAKEQRS